MSVTPFKAISFKKDDVVTVDQLDQLENNYQWVHDNTPRGRYHRPVDGTPLDVNTVLLGGRVQIKKNMKDDTGTASVSFGSRHFHPSCKPHVTTAVVSDFQRRIFCVVNGPGGINYPNSYGFEVKINVAAEQDKNDKIEKAFFVSWHAFGYGVPL